MDESSAVEASALRKRVQELEAEVDRLKLGIAVGEKERKALLEQLEKLQQKDADEQQNATE